MNDNIYAKKSENRENISLTKWILASQPQCSRIKIVYDAVGLSTVGNSFNIDFSCFLFGQYIFWKNNVFFLFCFLSVANNQGNERLTTSTAENRSGTALSSSSIAVTTASTLTTSSTPLISANPTVLSANNDRQTKNASENDVETPTNPETDEPNRPQTATEEEDFNTMCQMLEEHLRPVLPETKSKLSNQIFNEHKQLAKEYLKVCHFDATQNSII